MDAERERRAKNEAIFREVNERIDELSRRSGVEGEDSILPGFVCECSDEGCTELLEVTYKHYQAVRENPRRFRVVPGHEDPEVDLVVDRSDGSLIVEKRIEASRIALDHDPRE